MLSVALIVNYFRILLLVCQVLITFFLLPYIKFKFFKEM